MTPSGEGVRPPLHGIRILVVDNDEVLCEALVDVLTHLGANVTAKTSAEEALETLVRERPDVLLCDLGMPIRDGFWLIAQVRALPALQGGGTPAAAVTGHVLSADRAAILRAGFQYYVPKPIDFDYLEAVIKLLARKP